MEILFRLERGLESSDHDEREGARQVLHRMKNRDDLAASVEKTIDLLALEQVPSAPAPPEGHQKPSPAPTNAPRTPTRAAAASPASSAPTLPPTREPGPQHQSSAIPVKPTAATQQQQQSRHRAAVMAAAALVLVAAAAGLGLALQGGGDDDTSNGPTPTPTTGPTATRTDDPTREPPPSDPYTRRCNPKPVESYPGEVQPGDVATDYPDDRILRWACLLHEQGIIGNHELNFTGNYGGALPGRVRDRQLELGLEATGVLDLQFYDCLVGGICPTEVPPTPTPPTPTPTPGPTTETGDTL
jgi:hypothetical protein